MGSRLHARFAFGLLLTAAACALATAASGQKKEKPRTDGVIVLISAKTEGITEGAKIKQIETPKESTGKRETYDVRSKGKDQPRLNGIWVRKTCTITLADGKTLRKREVLVAIEVGKQTLKDLRYVETCQAQRGSGAGTWYAYTAVYDASVPPLADACSGNRLDGAAPLQRRSR